MKLTESQEGIIWLASVELQRSVDGYPINFPETVDAVKRAYLPIYDTDEAKREEILTTAAEKLSQLGK